MSIKHTIIFKISIRQDNWEYLEFTIQSNFSETGGREWGREVKWKDLPSLRGVGF